MLNKNSKSIVIGAPADFGIICKIKEELSSIGFEIQELNQENIKFSYKNIGQRLYNFYRKTILRDYTYKDYLRERAPVERLIKKVEQLTPTNHALIIRPDLYPTEVIELLRKKVKTLIAYQWDGLNRYPSVYNYINIFDRFYIFDPADTEFSGVLPTTNFHMNSAWENNPLPSNINKIYYLGSFENSRWHALSELVNTINETKVEKEIILVTYTAEQNLIAQQNKNITSIDRSITYKENLEKLQEASILLDLQNNIHNGISFRIFEAIGYDKKVITTNKDVKLYDFYSPEHIFVWEDQSAEQLLEFINAPNVRFPTEIKRKYSINNWIKYILDIDSYIPIDLPLEKKAKN